MNPELIKVKAYSNMPPTFSGKKFCAELRRLGYPNFFIKQGMHLTFLRRYCNTHGTAAWIKKELNKTEPKPYPVQSDIDKAIQLLKSNGYKIFKHELVEL